VIGDESGESAENLVLRKSWENDKTCDKLKVRKIFVKNLRLSQDVSKFCPLA